MEKLTFAWQGQGGGFSQRWIADGDKVNVYIYMGQKDQDGYYSEKCHFFFNFGA